MKISELMNTLLEIQENCGDCELRLQIDPRQPDVIMFSNTYIDGVDFIRLTPSEDIVILSNMYMRPCQYKDITATIQYDPDSKMYVGHYPTKEGFSGSFRGKTRNEAVINFQVSVREYEDFMENAQKIELANIVANTKKVVNDITNDLEDDEEDDGVDLDYGDIDKGPIEDDDEDEDEDYGNIDDEE